MRPETVDMEDIYRATYLSYKTSKRERGVVSYQCYGSSGKENKKKLDSIKTSAKYRTYNN
jgi:hypothetical protein